MSFFTERTLVSLSKFFLFTRNGIDTDFKSSLRRFPVRLQWLFYKHFPSDSIYTSFNLCSVCHHFPLYSPVLSCMPCILFDRFEAPSPLQSRPGILSTLKLPDTVFLHTNSFPCLLVSVSRPLSTRTILCLVSLVFLRGPSSVTPDLKSGSSLNCVNRNTIRSLSSLTLWS